MYYCLFYSQKIAYVIENLGVPGGIVVKNLPVNEETWVESLSGEDPLEKEMATQSNTVVWEIPWTKEPGRLQFLGSQTVGHN